MNDYTGNHTHTLDDKGRVSVPAQFRKQLPKEGLHIGRGLDGGLILYPPETWETVKASISDLSRNIIQQRNIVREISQYLHPVSIDGQGRIMIPSDLLEISCIDHEVLFIGTFNAIELWDPGRYTNRPRTEEEISDNSLEKAISKVNIDIY
ncbi:MAG: division/cell wall cluster transcriptional repressor MraZ [FCB group bacterium]|nr:division/cell wall cluster transcriptional repressor MraZ [FCB group bacterium]